MAIARVLGAKGLKGGVRVESLTDVPDRLSPGARVWVGEPPAPIHIERVESGGRLTVLYLEGVTTREAAEALADQYLEAEPRSLGPDEFYWDQLVGLRVEGPDGLHVGELVEVFRAGGNEVYRIVGPAGERLVPALRTQVLRIDLDAGLMVVAADEAEEVG